MDTTRRHLFINGKHNDAILYFYKALKKSGALKIIVKYVQKNNEYIFEDLEMLNELLYTTYHIRHKVSKDINKNNICPRRKLENNARSNHSSHHRINPIYHRQDYLQNLLHRRPETQKRTPPRGRLLTLQHPSRFLSRNLLPHPP